MDLRGRATTLFVIYISVASALRDPKGFEGKVDCQCFASHGHPEGPRTSTCITILACYGC